MNTGWKIRGVMFCMALSACGDAPPPAPLDEPALVVQKLEDAPVMPIDLQEVVNTYVLGGNRTDLQREAMTAKLVGATVSWRIKVYDIAKEDGYYRVISELMGASETKTFGKFTVVAFVNPRHDQDVQNLLKLQTGSEITVRGVVESITMRSALLLNPAELSD